ncbi:hypothetical protein F0U60_36635 [Archangium minus]|uniref:Uncharacterized protein n=1 Tax=Archangium minus TaxID=83450 RepID=A0ABY9X0V4_9BACT|nr:hypothetical protein F0U61_36420 [Archangium violaceum]WNG49032.1 hypothetical protein F0U60_36635 [Archangium minus]
MADKKDPNYAERIEHVQATHPDPWPGIKGRSEERETDLPTGTKREDQASVTEAQRKLEHEMHDEKEPTRE